MVKASKSERRYTRIDVVCKTHVTDVREEVKKILGVEVEPSAQEYFEQCTAAAKRVYENMNEIEKKRLTTRSKATRKLQTSQQYNKGGCNMPVMWVPVHIIVWTAKSASCSRDDHSAGARPSLVALLIFSKQIGQKVST
jgi:hypothetical protein